MSTISDIFRSYRDALTLSRRNYGDLYLERSQNTAQFYKDFGHRLIIPYLKSFADASSRRFLTHQIRRFFEQDTLDFVAIDGTCIKKPFADFITFYGGAYGAKGQLILSEDPPRIKYKKWALNKDVSMVAWVPVPFAQLSDIADPRYEEDFVLSDQEKVNLASIHTLVMQLAEIFLAYNTAASSEMEYPRILLMDLSPSSVLAATAQPVTQVGLVGYPYDRRKLDLADILIGMAHPFHEKLGLPSNKKFLRYRALIAALEQASGKPLSEVELAKACGLKPTEIKQELSLLQKYGVVKTRPGATGLIEAAVDLSASWLFSVSLFQNICARLFLKKDSTALQYVALDEEGISRRRWMAPGDLKFLIGIGMRALIEKCWEKKILLYGVVKDSESRYLTRNYLGVAQEIGFYAELKDLKIPPLPWTDRIFLENIPLVDEGLLCPWSTIEFDSAFMTLHKSRDEAGHSQVSGVMGRIVNQERLFLRSLAQFFLKKEKATPMMGHVVFLDRLAFPEWDLPEITPMKIATRELGEVSPLAFRDRETPNLGQRVMMYLLSVLTKNHFPEVMGYPDPLHKADWGAKTVGRRVAAAIESSAISFRANPISKTFRMIRDSFRR